MPIHDHTALSLLIYHANAKRSRNMNRCNLQNDGPSPNIPSSTDQIDSVRGKNWRRCTWPVRQKFENLQLLESRITVAPTIASQASPLGLPPGPGSSSSLQLAKFLTNREKPSGGPTKIARTTKRTLSTPSAPTVRPSLPGPPLREVDTKFPLT